MLKPHLTETFEISKDPLFLGLRQNLWVEEYAREELADLTAPRQNDAFRATPSGLRSRNGCESSTTHRQERGGTQDYGGYEPVLTPPK